MKNLDMDEEANIQERDSIHIEGNLSNHFSNSIENFKSTGNLKGSHTKLFRFFL